MKTLRSILIGSLFFLTGMTGFSLNTASLSATGSTTCVPVISVINIKTATAPWLQPGILVSLSSGAVLTYSVEVTGDDVLRSGYNAATGTWSPFTNMAALTTSASGTLGAAVTCIRLTVSAYTSGTATIQVVQQTVN